jgi:hypothetical protein
MNVHAQYFRNTVLQEQGNEATALRPQMVGKTIELHRLKSFRWSTIERNETVAGPRSKVA